MESAVITLQQKFGAQLHNIICKKVGHQDHCHDIMQEVYLKIMLHLPKVESATNTAAYLVRLTNNTVTDYFRKSKSLAEKDLSENLDTTDIVDSTEQSLQLADCCLKPMIESLPDIYRIALIKTELEGMKLKDYAQMAGISLSNAKVRVQRAKEKLKAIIQDCCTYEFDRYGNVVDCVKNSRGSCCK
ncbi:sigma-70 family RNA polymerase sigma factor [Paraflavitalea soli]|uniref:Sigma-70 family RNA polymerase sigma factor n=1 Tax=Paraflavitalea soli TaxID=2315862 RepID=A0A3B7MG36_9BACT|nr:sigma-70 family RNA polymerase sigma factor [Paraflavitalea soli]AXY72557.1 sigma-70 family RNA polymerase sigma factor [Paraflavitalea soli]